MSSESEHKLLSPSEIEEVIRSNVIILYYEGVANTITKDFFFSDCIADRYTYLAALLVVYWDKIDRGCFIDHDDVRIRSAGIFTYLLMMLTFGCSWGEIYSDPNVIKIMKAGQLDQTGILQAIMYEASLVDRLDPLMLTLLSELAASKCTEVKNDALAYALKAEIPLTKPHAPPARRP